MCRSMRRCPLQAKSRWGKQPRPVLTHSCGRKSLLFAGAKRRCGKRVRLKIAVFEDEVDLLTVDKVAGRCLPRRGSLGVGERFRLNKARYGKSSSGSATRCTYPERNLRWRLI